MSDDAAIRAAILDEDQTHQAQGETFDFTRWAALAVLGFSAREALAIGAGLRFDGSQMACPCCGQGTTWLASIWRGLACIRCLAAVRRAAPEH